MAFMLTSSRRNSFNELQTPPMNMTSPCNLSRNISPANDDFTYRTEAYLQEREEQSVSKALVPLTSKITWRNVMQQKRTLESEQEEIDRALSTINSIHGSFNRSMLRPHNEVYPSLYGDDDKSSRLLKSFCQRQDYYTNYDISLKHTVSDDEDSNTQDLSISYGNYFDSDFDDYSDDEEEKENEKKKSCDSGFGSALPKRHFSRESLLKFTQSLSKN
ncbi:unnamed protein product [Adineta ricciae]|uniref:Uncharacterized protein n=1 Tax=Adineta ricciae TaxID=249248 RepID=A0A816AJ98_ADIRI|nr:unnamed protein product [Adineta ricciae]